MAAGSYTVRFVQGFTWETEIGGLSAIVMQTLGTRGMALSDRGTLFDLQVRRGPDGIESIDVLQRIALADGIVTETEFIDSEGLALASETDVFVSFEQIHQVARFDIQTRETETLPAPPGFQNVARNRGLEALAIDDQGTLFTLAEHPRQGFDVWRWDENGWDQPFTLEARDGFLAVSAEVGPDGRFYLLERKITIFGFQTRLRRWDISQDAAFNETTLLTTRAGRFGNLEGLSLWRDGDGALRATMVSDNNFQSFMRTQLVEYVLTE